MHFPRQTHAFSQGKCCFKSAFSRPDKCMLDRWIQKNACWIQKMHIPRVFQCVCILHRPNTCIFSRKTLDFELCPEVIKCMPKMRVLLTPRKIHVKNACCFPKTALETRGAREPKSKPASLPMACGSRCFPAQGSEGKPRFKLFTVGKSTPNR